MTKEVFEQLCDIIGKIGGPCVFLYHEKPYILFDLRAFRTLVDTLGTTSGLTVSAPTDTINREIALILEKEKTKGFDNSPEYDTLDPFNAS
ncbi:hypothetical protein HYW94_03460 [Candidatus Uhrbacteria bacterium]|nr:hypothetical protein [Candidatus Uhrbacteria bacterium]